MIVEYCTIYLFMYNICNIWIKYKWTWGCNSSERSGIQWHFAVRYSDAGKRQEWGSSATIRDYDDWALAASSKNAVTRFIGFLYKQNHQMHMIWGYLSRFFGHRDSSIFATSASLGCSHFPLAQWQWHAQRLVLCQTKANLCGQRTAAQMSRCPDVHQKRPTNGRKWRLLFFFHIVWFGHNSQRTWAQQQVQWMESSELKACRKCMGMPEYVQYYLILKVNTKSKY